MKPWYRALSLALSFALPLGWLAPASAQSSDDTGIITITVTDSATKKPLPDARIFLIGATQASALTNRSGIVKYTDTPTGIYRVRVVKAGFQGSTSRQFEVLGNKEVAVDVLLADSTQVAASSTQSSSTDAGSGLKVIGTVQTRVEIVTRDIDSDSAIRRVSDSLTDALSKVAGVDVTQSSNDPDAAQTISLNGHDESQTAVTLDGIPLGAPGSAVNVRGVNTDLFGGASVSFSAQAGALGGSVNFRTLQPTQTWVTRFSTSYGTFDKFNYQLGETGSVGKLGIALLHTLREGNNQLTFNTYRDSSGLTYAHGGESSNVGDFLKLRYSLGDRTTVNLTALQNNSGTSSLCTQDVTILPCGIGPGNTSNSTYQFFYATVQSLIGNTTTSVTTFANTNNRYQNDALRYVNGVSLPLVSNTRSLARGAAFLSTLSQGKSTWTLNGSLYDSLTNFVPTVNTSPFVRQSVVGSASQTYRLSDQIKLNDRLSVGPNLSFAATNGAGSSLLGGLSGQWRPTASDAFGASVSLGSSQPAAGDIRTFSDPANARFNCAAGTADVSGPGDQPGRQSAVSYDANWSHQWKYGYVAIDGYQQRQGDQLINAQLVATSLGLGASDPYLQALQGFFAAPGACGVGSVLDPNNVYVNEALGNTTRVYRGFTLSSRIALGPHLVALASYQTNGAIVTAADVRLASANSTTIIGQQIPGRPVHRGNLTLDGDLPRLGLELLGNAQYVGANNGQHIAPYVLATLGASHAFGTGRLAFLVTNLFDTETAPFSSLLYSQPVPTSGGGVLFTAGNPNAPRQLTLSYSFNTGARSGAGGARQSRGAEQLAGNASGGGPRTRGLGTFTAFPPPAGVDPLSVADKRDSCKPDDAALAKPVLDQLRAAAAAYTAGEPLPPVDGLALVPHGDPKAGAWYFEVRPNLPRPTGATGGRGGFTRGGPGGPGEGGLPPTDRVVVAPRPDGTPGPRPSISPELRAAFAKFRSTISCSYFTALKQNDAREKGYTAFAGRNGLGYAPAIGLFVVQAPDLGTGGGSLKK